VLSHGSGIGTLIGKPATYEQVSTSKSGSVVGQKKNDSGMSALPANMLLMGYMKYGEGIGLSLFGIRKHEEQWRGRVTWQPPLGDTSAAGL
jgi:hypothetical protein